MLLNCCTFVAVDSQLILNIDRAFRSPDDKLWPFVSLADVFAKAAGSDDVLKLERENDGTTTSLSDERNHSNCVDDHAGVWTYLAGRGCRSRLSHVSDRYEWQHQRI